jgi:hypothetical protein
MTHEHDHDTVVVDSGGGSSSTGAILGVIGVIILLVAVWYFALGPGSTPSTIDNSNDNTINPPAVQSAAPGGSTAP